ncbi:CML25 [Symbiodinium sp. CCMP2592]|nr:CML25 [Symbiodinium sp. CCMP2592]
MAMRRPHGKAKAKAKMGVDDNPMDPEELKQVFQKIDLDGSGTVEMEEKLGIRCSKNSLKKVFKLIDTDGSGAIDFEEFSIFFARVSNPENIKEVLSEASAAFLDYRNSVEQDPSFAKHFPMPPSMNSVVKYSRHFNSTVESVRWVGDGTYLGATGEGKAFRSFVECSVRVWGFRV